MEADENATRVSRLIERRIDELKGVKSQKDIAREVGYRNQNMITMLKQGDAKVALERVPDLAKALEVDPAMLFRLVIEEYYSGTALKAIKKVFGTVVTEDEAEILTLLRELAPNGAPALTEKLAAALHAVYKDA